MVKFGWDKLKRFLAQANTWTGQQTFSNIAVTGGTIGGATITENLTTSTDPAANAAVTTAIVNSYNGVVVTLTAAGNTQTIQNPTTAATIRKFMVVNNDTSTHNLPVVANSVTFTLTPGEGQCFIWDGSAWGPTDLGITSLPVPVTQGGTGLTTITDHAPILGSGTDAVTPMAVGATKEVLVGSTGADPVWSSTPTVEELYGDNINVTEGLLSDPTITYVDDNHISVSSVDCAIRSDNSWGGTDNKLYVKTVAANNNLVVSAGVVNWIYVSYNAGTPIYAAAANNSAIDNSDVIPVARVYMGTGSIMAQLTYQYLGRGQAIRNLDRVMRTRGTGGIERESGLAISEGAGASVAVTTAAGFAWFGMRRITLDEITQGGSGVTSLLWYHSSGVWTSAAATGYNNTQYDNGTDLATLTSNRYAVNWIFRNLVTKQICIVLGTGDYTLAQAEASMIPSLPSCVENFSVLCGRIIVQKSATTAYAIEDVSDVSFRTSAVTVHNDLSGLNDGAYRHAPAAVADSDFIVGQASDGNWLKKTLAESRTILGLDGATTTVAVGGGANTAPVWTEATGSGAPVRATSPTLVTPILGTPASGTLTNCTGYAVAAAEAVVGVAELATNAEALAGTDTARIITPDDLKYVLDRRIQQYYGVSWDESADTYVRTGSTAGQTCGVTLADAFLPVHRRMRGCVVADDGTVNYYLCATDWTKKEDGATASDLTGTDGQVMVEIPKFWYRYGYSGTTHTYEVSPVPLTGFKVHEAFLSDTTEKDYLYVGAYEACLYDVSALKYVGQCYQTSVSAVFATSDDSITIATRTGWATALAVGQKLVITGTSNNNTTVTVKTIESATKITVDENLTDETAATTVIQTQTDVTDTTGDKLCSVSGVCPITGGSANGTRAHFRIWAQNRGGGKAANDAATAQWSQLYGDANSALQLLYLIEYASFYSQSVLGYGIAAVGDWPAYNDYNPIAKSGNGNAIGNISGCTATSAITTGAGATSVYLKYRGIENLYGHLWKFVDGYKVNDNIPYLCNNFANFSDTTSTTNYTNPLDVNGAAITMHNGNGYQGTLELTGRAFMPASVTDGSASAKITDYYYQNSGWRVVFSSGATLDAAYDGAFCLNTSPVLAHVHQAYGARLVMRK